MHGSPTNKTSETQYHARLERGWRMVNLAREAGNEEEATRLEDFWIALLKEYEAMMDQRMKGTPDVPE